MIWYVVFESHIVHMFHDCRIIEYAPLSLCSKHDALGY